MRRRLPLLLALAFLPLAPAQAASLNARAMLGAARSGRPAEVAVPVLGSIRISVWDSGVVTARTRFTTTDAFGRLHDAPREPFSALAGHVEGDPSSEVRVTVLGRSMTGYIHSRGHWIAIEPSGFVGEPPASADAATSPLPPVSVGTTGIPGVDGLGNCALVALMPCQILTAKVVLDGDYFFAAIKQSTCQSRQVSILNNVDGIYTRQVRIHLYAPEVNCRAAPDLGKRGSAALPYLQALAEAWNGTTADRSLVHLSAGFVFPQGAVGLSYQPGVCSRLQPEMIGPVELAQSCEFGYGIHQAVPIPRTNFTASTFLLTKIEAHEIGHSFNASHDPASICPRKPPRRGPIMCGILQESGPQTFSAQSAHDIRYWAERNIGSITGT